jgi:hypothetical protein
VADSPAAWGAPASPPGCAWRWSSRSRGGGLWAACGSGAPPHRLFRGGDVLLWLLKEWRSGGPGAARPWSSPSGTVHPGLVGRPVHPPSPPRVPPRSGVPKLELEREMHRAQASLSASSTITTASPTASLPIASSTPSPALLLSPGPSPQIR